MHKPALTAAALIIGAVALVGCSGSDPGDTAARPELPPTTTSAAATGQPAADTPETNERGHLVKDLGQEAGLMSTKGASGDVTFSIDKIEVDPECGEYMTPPESGHTLALHVRVATGDDTQAAEAASYVLNPYNFTEITSDGLTTQAQAGMCVAIEDHLTQSFGPNQKYSGIIELAVGEASGIVALSPQGGMPNISGWEWQY